MKKMKLHLIVLLLLVSYALNAQESPFHNFEDGSIQFLIADDVNIREDASTNAKVIATLPIATEIEIVKKTDEVYTIRDLELNWYKVSFVKDGETQMGYVWGGLIAMKSFYEEGSQNYFLFGINGFNEDDGYKKVEFQVRVANNYKEIDKMIVGTYPDFSSMFFKMDDNKGIQGIENVLMIDYAAEYCGGASGLFCFFYVDKKIYLAKELKEGFDAPYYHSEKLIFPKDECGLPNRVLWIMSGGDAEEIEPEEVGVKLYKWENLKLVEDK
jgi:Bacterial SH3 domain